MPERARKRVPDHRSNVSKGSLPKSPPTHPQNMEDPRLHKESELSESRESNSEKYGGAVPETMWKQVRAILY